MLICKNDPKRKYKGTEPSPKGLGWCAHAEKEGKVRKGADGNKWVIKRNKNGNLKWVKKSNKKNNIKISKKWFKNLTKTQYKTYDTLVSEVKKDLEKNNIKVIIYPLYLTNNKYYIIDNAWDYANNIVNENDPFIIIILNINNDNVLDINDKLYVQHSNITYNIKKKVIEIFKKKLGNKYFWNGKQESSISIKL